MQVHSGNVDVAGCGDAWDWSGLTCGRVTYVETAAMEGKEEEAVTGGVYLQRVVIKPKDRTTAPQDRQTDLHTC
jgi:hypothetical protein